MNASYDTLAARSAALKAHYEACKQTKDDAFDAYMEASRLATEAFDREHGTWNPNSLTTTLDAAPQYRVTGEVFHVNMASL